MMTTPSKKHKENEQRVQETPIVVQLLIEQPAMVANVTLTPRARALNIFESPSESGPAQRVMDHFECLNLILAQSPPNLTYDIQYHIQA
jgi:hypothetical protein